MTRSRVAWHVSRHCADSQIKVSCVTLEGSSRSNNNNDKYNNRNTIGQANEKKPEKQRLENFAIERGFLAQQSAAIKRDGGGCTKGTAFSMNAFRQNSFRSFRWLLPRAPQSRRRLVHKSGECNISRINIDKRGRHYLADIFTTLVDIKWRWNLFVFALAFTLSWIFFAFFWWLICYTHGDMLHHGDTDWKPCVAEVYDFSTALLFSIETQQTIGYGFRYTNPECPVAIVIMMFQSCFGIIIQALMTGLVFAKISRPKKRAQTLMFSKNALVCQRDDELCLLFRVADMRKSHIVEAQVRAIMVNKRVTREGEVLALYQRELQLGSEDDIEGRLFLVWPVIVEHRITPDSPLWDLSANDLIHRHFEILVILEGIVESTGMTTQARTSYLPNEILWGHRFERLVSYERDNGHYLIDYASFNSTFPVDMSPTSAKERAAEAADAITVRRGKNSDSSDDCAAAASKESGSRITTEEPQRACMMDQTSEEPLRGDSQNPWSIQTARVDFELEQKLGQNYENLSNFNLKQNDIDQFI